MQVLPLAPQDPSRVGGPVGVGTGPVALAETEMEAEAEAEGEALGWAPHFPKPAWQPVWQWSAVLPQYPYLGWVSWRQGKIGDGHILRAAFAEKTVKTSEADARLVGTTSTA